MACIYPRKLLIIKKLYRGNKFALLFLDTFCSFTVARK